jgi:hypothetical protein
MSLFNLFKREGPGRCHRVGVVDALRPAFGKQCLTMGLIQLQVVLKATSRFFDIGTSPFNGERKMIEDYDNISGLIDLVIGSLCVSLCSTQQEVYSLDKAHLFYVYRHC